MKREELKQVIKIMSGWRIDKRRDWNNRGIYQAVKDYTRNFMAQNQLAFLEDGSIVKLLPNKMLLRFNTTLEQDKADAEYANSYIAQDREIGKFVKSMLYKEIK